MRAARKRSSDPDMRPEYNFKGGVRGKYVLRLPKGSSVVVIAPDVAEVFKTSEAVNAALRSQLEKKPARRAPKRRPAKR